MIAGSRQHDLASLGARLHSAQAVTRPLMQDIIDKSCQRLLSLGQSERTARLAQLIDAGAWADTALALLELELPLWRVRRIIYDDGEWYCSLSRERELPDWLDASIEARHSDLALALLSAFAEAQTRATEASRPSPPPIRQTPDLLCEPLICDDFG